MHFGRSGEYLTVSRITGPKHNLLEVRVDGVLRDERPICECLPPRGACSHEPLNEADVIDAVLEGVAEANRRLGTSYAVTHMRYVQGDTKPEEVYGYMALKVLERLHSGGAF